MLTWDCVVGEDCAAASTFAAMGDGVAWRASRRRRGVASREGSALGCLHCRVRELLPQAVDRTLWGAEKCRRAAPGPSCHSTNRSVMAASILASVTRPLASYEADHSRLTLACSANLHHSKSLRSPSDHSLPVQASLAVPCRAIAATIHVSSSPAAASASIARASNDYNTSKERSHGRTSR